MPEQTAIFAGGCFWCLEAVFDRLKGVRSVESGYIGGDVKNPAYREVCAGTTGHAEAVRITFDPGEISFDELLDVFFAIHDPTTKDRQGNDVGTQYRSGIFYTSEEQKRAAEEKLRALAAERAFPAPIVTEVTAAGPFYVAEGYHQEYFENNPTQPYCQMIVAPKVRKALEKFGEKMAARK
jgi:peptide-methionine (S)-S-oxide reductase